MIEETIKHFDYDDDDYSELLLKYLIRDSEVFTAAQRTKLLADDFIVGLKGSKLYKEFANVAFELNNSPCDKELFRIHLANKAEQGILNNYDGDKIEALFEMIFEFTPQNTENIVDKLPEFIKHRRTNKILTAHKGEPLRVADELAKLNDEFTAVSVSAQAVVLDPFAGMVAVAATNKKGIPTGVGKVDAKTGGLGRGECGLLIGHSGTGKTAVATYIMRKAAIAGFKALYISCEEPAENIIHRWYAQQFKINYTEMYRGNAEMEKQQAFGQITPEEKEDLSRLRIVDVRPMAPLSAKTIKEVIDQQVASGFIPAVVLIDQLDYLKPLKIVQKNAAKWQEYEQVAFELDHLSQQRIGPDENEFALWVLHQATGDMTWEFTYNDIAGFKGIVKPFDIAIGIGREDREANHINLFSLKVRHSEHFKAPQLAEFGHMTFTDDPSYKPKEQREREDRSRTKAAKGKTKEGLPTVLLKKKNEEEP